MSHCVHRWKRISVQRFSLMRGGTNAIAIWECRDCPATKTENVLVGPAKMKGKGAK